VTIEAMPLSSDVAAASPIAVEGAESVAPSPPFLTVLLQAVRPDAGATPAHPGGADVDGGMPATDVGGRHRGQTPAAGMSDAVTLIPRGGATSTTRAAAGPSQDDAADTDSAPGGTTTPALPEASAAPAPAALAALLGTPAIAVVPTTGSGMSAVDVARGAAETQEGAVGSDAPRSTRVVDTPAPARLGTTVDSGSSATSPPVDRPPALAPLARDATGQPSWAPRSAADVAVLRHGGAALERHGLASRDDGGPPVGGLSIGRELERGRAPGTDSAGPGSGAERREPELGPDAPPPAAGASPAGGARPDAAAVPAADIETIVPGGAASRPPAVPQFAAPWATARVPAAAEDTGSPPPLRVPADHARPVSPRAVGTGAVAHPGLDLAEPPVDPAVSAPARVPAASPGEPVPGRAAPATPAPGAAAATEPSAVSVAPGLVSRQGSAPADQPAFPASPVALASRPSAEVAASPGASRPSGEAAAAARPLTEPTAGRVPSFAPPVPISRPLPEVTVDPAVASERPAPPSPLVAGQAAERPESSRPAAGAQPFGEREFELGSPTPGWAPVSRSIRERGAEPPGPADGPDARREPIGERGPERAPAADVPVLTSRPSPIEAPAAPAEPSAPAPRPVVEQVVERLVVLRRQGRDEISFRLEPPELGAVRVEVVLENGRLRVDIRAEAEPARHVLESALPRLRESLAQQGIATADVSVHLGLDSAPRDSTRGQPAPSPRPSPAAPAAAPVRPPSSAPAGMALAENGVDVWV
jgi:flagellar hook-length control protein FliK